MNKLTKILLAIVLIMFCIQIVGRLLGWGVGNNSLIYLYSFIILCLIPFIFKKIRNDFFTDYFKKNYKKPVILILLEIGLVMGFLLVWLKGVSPLLLIPWAYFLFSFLYVFESRTSAIIAVILLGYTLIFFLLRQPEPAKAIANYAYIFLVIMALTQIREYRLKKPELTNTKIVQHWPLVSGSGVSATLAILKIISVFLLMLFFIGIFLCNSGIITEFILMLIAIITAIVYIVYFIFNIGNEDRVAKVLNKWGEKNFIKKSTSVLSEYFGYVLLLNIFLFPLMVFGTYGVMILIRTNIVSAFFAENVLLLYLLSAGLLLINSYTVNMRRGFLTLSEKTGVVLKTLLYIIIPALSICILLVSNHEAVINWINSLLLAVFSLWLAYLDLPNRTISKKTKHTDKMAS